MFFCHAAMHICLQSRVWAGNVGSSVYQRGGLRVGFHNADLEQILKCQVSCTAFRMVMPILILIAVSRIPTEICSLFELCVSVSLFSLVRGFKKKTCCTSVLSSFCHPGFSLCILVPNLTTQMNFSIMFLLLLHADLSLSQLKVHW